MTTGLFLASTSASIGADRGSTYREKTGTPSRILLFTNYQIPKVSGEPKLKGIEIEYQTNAWDISKNLKGGLHLAAIKLDRGSSKGEKVAIKSLRIGGSITYYVPIGGKYTPFVGVKLLKGGRKVGNSHYSLTAGVEINDFILQVGTGVGKWKGVTTGSIGISF